MTDPKQSVEAILFAVGKEITTERISALSSLTMPQVEELILTLQKEYEEHKNALHIVKKENGWKLTVRDEFVPLVSSIVSSTELERPLMDTLAVIAWRYPVLQSDVIKLRSPAAYEHMKELEARGFIMKERFGRSYKLKLTPKFFEYFDLPSEQAKQAFLQKVPASVLEEAENVDKEADEVERLIELDKKEKVARHEIKKAMDDMKKEEE